MNERQAASGACWIKHPGDGPCECIDSDQAASAEVRRECPRCCNEISDPTDVSCNVCSATLPLPAPYCHCGCCREATAKARTGRPVVEGCSCADYGPAEKCDCPYCLLVREVA